MSLTSRIATSTAPLVISFGLMASTALAQEAEPLSFKCDIPDLSGMALADRVDRIMPGNVFVSTSFLKEKNDQNDGVEELDGPEKTLPLPPKNAMGSGYIVDTRGYIVTNNHVIDGSNQIHVNLYDPTKPGHVGKEVTATLVGSDKELDVAVLKIDYEGDLTCVKFGDSDQLRRSDSVFAVGNPLGLSFTYTQGTISHPKQSFIPGSLYDHLQTDTAINRGNSGGALYDTKTAHVVGMNTAIASPNGGSIGIGFASAANDIVKVVDDIIKHGEAKRGALGVGIQDVSKKAAEELNVVEGVGVLVTGMAPDGPAEQGGILVSDIILEVNGKKVNSSSELARDIARHDPEEVVQLKILRDGQEQTLDVTLGERTVALKGLQRPPIDQQPESAPEDRKGGFPPEIEKFLEEFFQQLPPPPKP